MTTFDAQTKKTENGGAKSRGVSQNFNDLQIALINNSAPPSGLFVQRKAGCACGGSCPACQSGSSNLPVSQPTDNSEIEADTVADQVMQMPVSDASPSRRETSRIRPLINLKRENSGVGSGSGSGFFFPTSGGKRLDPETRTFMENRFGASFGNVKIHADAQAAGMSRALHAKAFTVGSDIYFNQGQYRPQTDAGKHLLAHELAHTLQQDGAVIKRQSDDAIDVDIMVEDPAEAERLRREHEIELPAGSIVWSLLSPALIARIQQILTQNGITPAAVPSTAVSNPVFVLHDTAVAMGSRAISNAVSGSRGPLGGGAAAYVPATGGAAVARSNFFDRRRPTATEFEKGNDILSLQDRLTNARIIWQNTSASVRQAAMQTALNGLGLTPAEVASETAAAVAQLNAATNSTSLVYSTGMWTVNEICNQITAGGISTVVNNTANTATLQAAYDIMRPFFATRNRRIESSVNIEIVQQRGSDCNPRGTALPAYTPAQYSNTALLYLQSALQAGRFPQITTHFLVDKNAGSHCDPRCFNLTSLYSNIAGLLTFPAGSSFGITPQYGTGATDNVWWSNPVCGGSHP